MVPPNLPVFTRKQCLFLLSLTGPTGLRVIVCGKHPFLRSGVWEAQSFWAECLLRLAVFPTGRQSPDLTVRRDNKLGGFCKLCSTCLQLEMVADPWGHLTGLGFIQ